MTLKAGFHALPPGTIAAVVTHLELRSRPPARRVAWPNGTELRRVATPDPQAYRDIFSRVGGADWLWFSRLRLTPDALAATLAAPGTEVHVLTRDGRAEGLLELAFDGDACKLAFFGLTPAVQGIGAGRAMMEAALDLAFARPIARLSVHTCTLDSPAALPFYLRSGFVPLRREIEVAHDPRLDGTLPRDAAPYHPVID